MDFWSLSEVDHGLLVAIRRDADQFSMIDPE
jgi:hypothetical protein